VTDLDVKELGDGTPALFVHGALTTAEENWEAQLPLADDGFRLVLPNRRGYGRSPEVRGEDFLRDGEDVADLLDGGTHLVGHSYGGMCALVAAARRPDAVRSLALLEPPMFAVASDDPHVAAFLPAARELWSRTELSDREWLKEFLRLVGEAPEEIPDEMLDTWASRASLVRNARSPWDAELPLEGIAAAGIPTLVLKGGHHPAFDAACDELARRLGGSCETVAGAGHEIQMMGEPCNRVLLEHWSTA
jgi:pimeloyl-ACP methyl ester carboxylesterase